MGQPVCLLTEALAAIRAIFLGRAVLILALMSGRIFFEPFLKNDGANLSPK
jgi:hypothetical protein